MHFFTEPYDIKYYYHTHFIDEITEAEGGRLLNQNHIALNERAKIYIPFS